MRVSVEILTELLNVNSSFDLLQCDDYTNPCQKRDNLAVGPYIQLLRNNTGFTYLWTAQIVSLLGDWFNTIALSALVARFTDGSGIAVGVFLMARFLPPLIVGPFAGALVDRFDRKTILIYSNILRTGIVLMFLLATSPDLLWLIYVLTIIQFSLSALFEPGQSALIPSLIAREDLVIANTLTSITWSVMLAVGAIIGGIVGALFGTATALVIDALTFALAAYLIWRIDVPPRQIDPAATEDDNDDNGSILQGLRYLRRNPPTIAVMLVKGGGSLGNTDTLMTIYATEIFILGTDGQLSLGILYSAFGLGALMGPLLLNRINNGTIFRMTQLIAFGFFLAVMGWVILGVSTTLVLVSIGLFVRAMGGSANWTYSSVILQKTVPDRYLGRVFALDLAAFQLATVLSIVIHGVLIDVLSNQATQNNPINAIHAGSALATIRDFFSQLTTPDLLLLTVGTGIVSLIPLIVWIIVIPRIKQRQAEIA